MDQFSEWDKFYAEYERVFRPAKGLKNYARKRRAERAKAAGKKASETRARKRQEAAKGT